MDEAATATPAPRTRQKRRPGQSSSHARSGGGSATHHSRSHRSHRSHETPSSGGGRGRSSLSRKVSFDPQMAGSTISVSFDDRSSGLSRHASFDPSVSRSRHHRRSDFSPSAAAAGGEAAEAAWAKLVARAQNLEEALASERASRRLLAARSAQERVEMLAELAKAKEDRESMEHLWRDGKAQLLHRQGEWDAERAALYEELGRLRVALRNAGHEPIPPSRPPVNLAFALADEPDDTAASACAPSAVLTEAADTDDTVALDAPPRPPPVQVPLSAEKIVPEQRGRAASLHARTPGAPHGEPLVARAMTVAAGGTPGGAAVVETPLVLAAHSHTLLRSAALQWTHLPLAMPWRAWRAHVLAARAERAASGASAASMPLAEAAAPGVASAMDDLATLAKDVRSMSSSELASRVADLAAGALGDKRSMTTVSGASGSFFGRLGNSFKVSALGERVGNALAGGGAGTGAGTGTGSGTGSGSGSGGGTGSSGFCGGVISSSGGTRPRAMSVLTPDKAMGSDAATSPGPGPQARAKRAMSLAPSLLRADSMAGTAPAQRAASSQPSAALADAKTMLPVALAPPPPQAPAAHAKDEMSRIVAPEVRPKPRERAVSVSIAAGRADSGVAPRKRAMSMAPNAVYGDATPPKSSPPPGPPADKPRVERKISAKKRATSVAPAVMREESDSLGAARTDGRQRALTLES